MEIWRSVWEIWFVVFPVVSCPKCCLWTGSCSSCLNTSPHTTSPWYRPGSHPPYWCPSLLSDSGELPLYGVFTLRLFICFQIWIDTCWSVMSAVHWCTSWVINSGLMKNSPQTKPQSIFPISLQINRWREKL